MILFSFSLYLTRLDQLRLNTGKRGPDTTSNTSTEQVRHIKVIHIKDVYTNSLDSRFFTSSLSLSLTENVITIKYKTFKKKIHIPTVKNW